jgi:transposase InsO family protein
MTKSPKKSNAKTIEKHNEELRKKRREDHFQKKRFQVAVLRAEGRSTRQISEYLGMSVGFVHKWCRRLVTQISDIRKAAPGRKKIRYTNGGIREEITSRSTAPKNPFRKITREHREAVKEIRKGKFTKRMGAQKIKVYAGMDISHQSIHKIMREEKLVVPYKKRKQRSFTEFRREGPNELWQIDYKEFGRGIYMLSVKDDHSSMILSADVRTTCTTDDVKQILDRTIGLFGKPRQILSDHGTQWCASNGGTARFDEWCSERGIEHIMGKVRKPTTQGKIERWHGSVLEEADLPPKGSSAAEYGKAVLEYMEFYNNERPHHGIGLRVPVHVYAAGLILPEILAALGVHEVP